MGATGKSGHGAAVAATAAIVNERGLHARAAAKLVKVAERYQSEISVAAGGQTVSGRSIMGLLMLAAVKGTEVTISATGPDAEAAVADIVHLIDDLFEEGPEA